MTKEEQCIINALLDRYESSKKFREGSSNRRIFLKFSGCKAITGQIRNSDDQRAFLEALEKLQGRGLLTFTWVRYEKGNLVDTVYLTEDPDRIKLCYRETGRMPKAKMLEELDYWLELAGSEDEADDPRDIPVFFLEMREQIRRERKIPKFFFQPEQDPVNSMQKNRDLIRFLTELAGNQQEQLERVISARLFGDSKYFERELKSRAVRVLRYLADPEASATDDQLLQSRGIFRWPEIMEFCGDLILTLKNGNRIDYSGQIYGAYINSRTVQETISVEPGCPITRILSIENKANYTWYLAGHRKTGELVLYHGGVYSPVKGHWFSMLADALPDVPAYHWSDIDLGGFRIFYRLKKNVFFRLNPYRMGLSDLQSCEDRCTRIENDHYRKELEKILKEFDYREFYDVIRYMLDKDIRLEQEQMI